MILITKSLNMAHKGLLSQNSYTNHSKGVLKKTHQILELGKANFVYGKVHKN